MAVFGLPHRLPEEKGVEETQQVSFSGSQESEVLGSTHRLCPHSPQLQTKSKEISESPCPSLSSYGVSLSLVPSLSSMVL